MRRVSKYLSLAALITAQAIAAEAAGVTVYSPDNSVSISGEILSYDDEFITLSTNLGEIKLNRRTTRCEGEGCPKGMEALSMTVAMSEEQIATLMQRLVDEYAQNYDMMTLSVPGERGLVKQIKLQETIGDPEPAGTVDVSFSTQPDLFNSVLEGQANLAVSAVAATEDVVARNRLSSDIDLNDPTRERVLALDAIVPVVHPDNRVRSLSIEELARIAAGRIRNWSELGGENLPIRFVMPAEGTSLDATFNELVLDPNRVRLRRSVQRADSQNAALNTVKSDPGAITITGLGMTGSTNIVPIRQVCGPLAHATDFTVKAEEYPLTRRILAYSGNDGLSGTQSDFLEFATSDAAQPLIKAAGYIDQSIDAQAVGEQGARMTSAILSADNATGLGLVQDFTRDLATADRLSTTFRFLSGSSRLDTKSEADIQRMVDYLNSAEGRRREILVIGFTDNVGRFDLNSRLALQRATNVRDALVAARGGDALTARLDVSSYGPLAPVGCNETADGRDSNRRVEIWLR